MYRKKIRRKKQNLHSSFFEVISSEQAIKEIKATNMSLATVVERNKELIKKKE